MREAAELAGLRIARFALWHNDRTVIVYGGLLTTLTSARDAACFASTVDSELAREQHAPPLKLSCQPRHCHGRRRKRRIWRRRPRHGAADLAGTQRPAWQTGVAQQYGKKLPANSAAAKFNEAPVRDR